jgi:HAD superfamily hydrolase (TIGR01509 family)
MLKAVIFDLDQTLVDWDAAEPWEDYQVRRLQRVFNFVNSDLYPLPDVDVTRFITSFANRLGQAWADSVESFVAPSVVRVLTDALIELGVPPDRVDLDRLMRAYDWQPPEGERAYPDVLEVLPTLRDHGVELGIITNASLSMVYRDRELQAFGLIDLFPNCRIAAVDVGVIKPHPVIFEKALDLLDIEPHEAAFVGDNIEADIRGARDVGMRAVLRLRAGERPTYNGVVPDGTIVTMHDLLPLLDGWYPGWRSNGAGSYDAA